ncbi:PAAR domain-containing protein [Moritella sp. 5]|nr:PAAR domain-containing protein [Moritella sp. 5]
MEATQQNIPSYLTGDAPETTMHPSYPVIKNTRVFPDENVRALLTENNHDVMLLTLPEIFEVLQSWGWKDTKETWVETTQSTGGQVLINYGVNGKDVVTTSMIIAKLGDFGIKATVYMNHKGTELIKFTGYAGVRQILNAPVFGLKNPKVVDVGIGKYGLKNSIIQGARVTFYVAAAYRTIDFILNDETSLAEFIGSLATDVAKIGIASAISWGVGGLVVASTSFVTAPLAIVVLVGLGASIALNILDEKYEVTDHVVKYLERAQQEVMEKAKEIENGFWDLGGMFIDGFLDTGKEIIESEIKNYVKKGISQLTPRIL